MKKFSEFIVGESFYSTCSISNNELESYLKFSSEANDANGIAIISPEDVDFKSAIGKANGDFALSSSNINEESLAYFANKYPSMGYWK